MGRESERERDVEEKKEEERKKGRKKKKEEERKKSVEGEEMWIRESDRMRVIKKKR